MAEKHLVVQGAICMCNFGAVPDNLKVLTHRKEYVNDEKGAKKLIVSTMDIGPTFERNTFGVCTKIRATCAASVLEWKGFYKDIVLSNGGQVLLEDSVGSCPIGGSGCIRIVHHGQITEMGKQNFKQANPDTQNLLNPAVDINDILKSERTHDGLITS